MWTAVYTHNIPALASLSPSATNGFGTGAIKLQQNCNIAIYVASQLYCSCENQNHTNRSLLLVLCYGRMYDLHSVQTRSSSVTPCTAIVSSCFIAVLLDVRKLHYFDSLSTCCTTCCTTSCTIRIHQKSAASNKCTTS